MTSYTFNGTEQEKKIYAGVEFEKDITSNTSYSYIYAGNEPIAVYIQNDSNKLYYLHSVLNGSISYITDTEGNIVDTLSYTPFGQRRLYSDWSKTDTAKHLIDRGFTGQQHLDEFALINFNGRMYDPVLAHFLSPDPYIQSPENPLNYNRYSYCLFSPLQYVDPTGLLIDDYFDAFGNYLGSDNALTDNVRIIDREVWDMFKYINEDGTESILHQIGNRESIAFSEAFDMLKQEQLSVYQHYNPTDLPLELVSTSSGMTFHAEATIMLYPNGKKVINSIKKNILVSLNNKERKIADNANNIISMFVHENQHYNDYKKLGHTKYFMMDITNRENNAIMTQIQHSSWNKTDIGFRNSIKKYAKEKYGITF